MTAVSPLRAAAGARVAVLPAPSAHSSSCAPSRALALLWAAATLLLLSFVAPAEAGQGEGEEGGFASQLIETGTVYAPRGFSDLCARRPEFCAAEKAAAETDPMAERLAAMFGRAALAFAPPEPTRARLEGLARVNAAVNAAIRPVADAGADYWELNATAGDCEEYVLMKREMLARLGWPRTALRITVVRDGPGYHAVLVAETAGGAFVLDNMVPQVGRLEDSPYEYVVSQSIQTPGAWVRVTRR